MQRLERAFLAGVDGVEEVVVAQQVEGRQMVGGRVPLLAAGDIESGYQIRIAVAQRQLSDFQAAVSVPHRAQQLSGDERFAGRCGRIHALAQALGDGLDCLVQAQPGAQMLLGRPAGLTGDNPVGDLIVHPLAGDPA
ncbi:hypothetical protein SDC9_188294 [bioreactor metagenome]|uniref:Uncharacterized protein n=1 Tax=bioreactor metagenome TaxID=1076179 RepID=A0A645HNX4_9ZZZZ